MDAVLDRILAINPITLPLLKLISSERWRISRIKLSNCKLDASLFKLLLACRDTITSISLEACIFDRAHQKSGIKLLGQFLHLRHLEIRNCVGLTVLHLCAVKAKIFELESLTIYEPLDGLAKLFTPDGLQTASLNSLRVSKVSLDSRSLQCILTTFRDCLGSLELTGISMSKKERDNFIATFTASILGLRHLEIDAFFLDVRFLLGLTTWFPNLEEVTLDEKRDDDPFLNMTLVQLESFGIRIITRSVDCLV